MVGGYAAYGVGIRRDVNSSYFVVAHNSDCDRLSEKEFIERYGADSCGSGIIFTTSRHRCSLFACDAGTPINSFESSRHMKEFPEDGIAQAKIDWRSMPRYRAFAFAMFAIAFVSWALPALGFVRMGLVSAAATGRRDVRSVAAAVLLESHRMPITVAYLMMLYLGAVLVAAASGISIPIGFTRAAGVTSGYAWLGIVVIVLSVFASSAGWIGALRSDPMCQVIPSRLRAASFFVLFCMVLAPITCLLLFYAGGLGDPVLTELFKTL